MTAKAIVNNKEKVFDKSSNEWIEEKDATCDCGRKIPEEQHTGDCLLEHFLAYNCGNIEEENKKELLSIIGIIKEEVRH